MTRYVVRVALALAALAAADPAVDAQRTIDNADNVILITLDGVRVEEMFGGLDREILQSTLKKGQPVEDQPVYRRFWADSPEARRERLMPFFWKVLMSQYGSIAGNPALSSSVRLTNRHRFSYPGYAEILLGEAHDDVIWSNDPTRNPYSTILETVRERLVLPAARVSTFASWAHFNAIAEHREGATFINAGQEVLHNSGASIHQLNAWQFEAAPPWDAVRFDVFTFRAAMAHLESARPRLLYLSFDETDDWAHDGRYDRLLDAYARTDAYLKELWEWIEGQADYRGRTHLLITTDHGRGRTAKDWRDHGERVAGAEDVWIAFVSPAMSRRGEWKSHPPLFTNQIAATLARWLGVNWNELRPKAGLPIS
jgi:Type I phosphodiesterase / nucleotide pyrophosphatase